MTFYNNFSSPITCGNKDEVTKRVADVLKILSTVTTQTKFIAHINKAYWRRLIGKKGMRKLHQRRLKYLRKKGARK